MTIAIKVENLSKKYIIRHETKAITSSAGIGSGRAYYCLKKMEIGRSFIMHQRPSKLNKTINTCHVHPAT